MTESITTPTALVQTTNGKRFYVNSGVVAVPNSETSIIDIDNIGERDIKIAINLFADALSTNDITLKIKSNGIIIYQSKYNNTYQHYIVGFSAIKMVFPANTSLLMTLESQTDTHNLGIACYGRYLSM